MAAYRKAKELDPDNAVTRQNLAILLEHDREGFRYGPQANLDFGRIAEHYGVADAAAQAYRKVEAPEREEDLLTSTYGVAQRRLEALAAEPQSDAPTRGAVPKQPVAKMPSSR
ncbi:MAG: hypothetical protein GY856_44725 [bacterium]|nr:hypothetical protein [bacterium]